MKLTKEQLKSIIKEQLRKALNEDITFSKQELQDPDVQDVFGLELTPKTMHEFLSLTMQKHGLVPIPSRDPNVSRFKSAKYKMFKEEGDQLVFEVTKLSTDQYKTEIKYESSPSSNYSYDYIPAYIKKLTGYELVKKLGLRELIPYLGNPYTGYNMKDNEFSEVFEYFIQALADPDWYEQNVKQKPQSRQEKEAEQGQAFLKAKAKQFEPTTFNKAQGQAGYYGPAAGKFTGLEENNKVSIKNKKK